MDTTRYILVALGVLSTDIIGVPTFMDEIYRRYGVELETQAQHYGVSAEYMLAQCIEESKFLGMPVCRLIKDGFDQAIEDQQREAGYL